MMDLKPCPGWIATVIRIVQGDEGAIGAACLLAAGSLVGMMGAGSLAAWQAGLL